MQILLDIQIAENGSVHSDHHLASESQGEASDLPGGGLTQVAYAMLVEALRRELRTEILLDLSHNAGLLGRFREDPEKAVKELTGVSLEYLGDMAAKLLPELAREALNGMCKLQDPSE